MAAPAPWKNRADYLDAEHVAEDIANLLAPQAGSYYDVWLDGEKWYSETFEVGLLLVLVVAAPRASVDFRTVLHACADSGVLMPAAATCYSSA